TQTIRWKCVTSHFLQFLACAMFMYIILDEFFIPKFQDFNKENITVYYFGPSLLSALVPSTFLLIL
ncbi:sterol O-acyltransferase 1 isoform X2, partial [Biomphalaria glabrata]